jgi:hypothetical protein
MRYSLYFIQILGLTSTNNIMKQIMLIFCLIFVFSCKEKKNIVSNIDRLPNKKSFINIKKDSAFIKDYVFTKKKLQGNIIVFDYSNVNYDFSLSCDTSKMKFQLVFSNEEPVKLQMNEQKIFIVNGVEYTLYKLTVNKGSIDGEISLFVNPQFGLILSKSNTWDSFEIIELNKENNEHLVLGTLIYKLLNEKGFINTKIPKTKIKFTTPKFE